MAQEPRHGLFGAKIVGEAEVFAGRDEKTGETIEPGFRATCTQRNGVASGLAGAIYPGGDLAYCWSVEQISDGQCRIRPMFAHPGEGLERQKGFASHGEKVVCNAHFRSVDDLAPERENGLFRLRFWSNARPCASAGWCQRQGRAVEFGMLQTCMFMGSN